jgi:hypothetical protein
MQWHCRASYVAQICFIVHICTIYEYILKTSTSAGTAVVTVGGDHNMGDMKMLCLAPLWHIDLGDATDVQCNVDCQYTTVPVHRLCRIDAKPGACFICDGKKTSAPQVPRRKHNQKHSVHKKIVGFCTTILHNTIMVVTAQSSSSCRSSAARDGSHHESLVDQVNKQGIQPSPSEPPL